MLNCNVFSGLVIAPPQLILIGENTPLAFFILDLRVSEGSAGMITVVCQQPFALAAVRDLSPKEYVVIEGFIRNDKIPIGDGTYVHEVHLFALQILKCKVLGL